MNMKAHQNNNTKIGFTFVSVIAFLMQIMTLSQGFQDITNASIVRLVGGDLSAYVFDTKTYTKNSFGKKNIKMDVGNPIYID